MAALRDGKTAIKRRKIDTEDVEEKTDKKSDHILRKRLPLSFPKTKKDFYVSNKTNFKAQLKKCEKLLDSEPEIIIHGLGAAINRACNLGLQLKENHNGTLEIDVQTSTVQLIDDLEPVTDDADYETKARNNSAIHIRVFRTVVIGGLKYEK